MPAVPTPHSPSPGAEPEPATGRAGLREFGGYQILERVETDVASGTITYRARQKSLGRMVRVTVLPRAWASKSEFLARFQRQVGVLSRLKHDNVLSAFDAGTSAGIPYVVFEELDGRTLAEEITFRGALPLPRVMEIGIDAARGLEHVAALGLVHRNLRPATVHLPEHSPAKLVGLGIAKVRVANGAETWHDHDVDSAQCVSPESVRGARGIDIRADVYALGCVLFHAAIGRPVFPGGTPATILARHATEAPPDPRTLRDGLPEPFVRVLDRCLRKEPAERYARPVDLAKDLELAKAGRPVERGPGTPLWKDPEKPRSRLGLPSLRRKS